MTSWTGQYDRASQMIRDECLREGFDAVAITVPAGHHETARRLEQFLARGHHGTMNWMAETAARRADPKALWPDTASIVMVAMNYGPDDSTLSLDALEKRDCATISVYAHNRDYHDVMKGRLKQVAGRFAARYSAQVKVFVDTAPVMEKPLAAAAGLGWQGKHTNLVSRTLGSWFFIGSIFTDRPLEPDTPEIDHCGSCRACLDICPTNAFPAPYQLDARRCISYLTIEHHGMIPLEFRKAMGNRIYGCDDCLAVCPWNKFASAAREQKLASRATMRSPKLAGLLRFDDAQFRAFFSGSPVKRIGRDRFIRNCLIAAGNSADTALLNSVIALLHDPCPLVRGTAVWSWGQLADNTASLCAAARKALKTETEEDVRTEWLRLIGDKENNA